MRCRTSCRLQPVPVPPTTSSINPSTEVRRDLPRILQPNWHASTEIRHRSNPVPRCHREAAKTPNDLTHSHNRTQSKACNQQRDGESHLKSKLSPPLSFVRARNLQSGMTYFFARTITAATSDISTTASKYSAPVTCER